MGDVTAIIVPPGSWEDASDLDRDEYRRRAQDLEIDLTVEGVEDDGYGPVILIEDGEVVPATFDGAGSCPLGRRPWEHVVRRVLSLPDPCLGG